MKRKIIKDFGTYRRLLAPHDSADAARAAMNAFWGEANALRKKYGIPDVLVVMQANAIVDGHEELIRGCGHWGDESHGAALAAHAYRDCARTDFALALGGMIEEAKEEAETDAALGFLSKIAEKVKVEPQTNDGEDEGDE